MKQRKTWLAMILVLPAIITAQTNNVGINTETPNVKSILEIYAKNTGVLLPRMTTNERNAIAVSTLSKGLLIYNTDEKCFNSYNTSTSSWNKMCGILDNSTTKNALISKNK